MGMQTRPLTKADYDQIVRVIDRWWGGPTSALAHPMFFYELGRLARVVESDNLLVGFLLGFICPDAEVGYVHLVGIHPDYRRRGVGNLLYKAFEEDCAREAAGGSRPSPRRGTRAACASTRPLAGPWPKSKITLGLAGSGSCLPRA